MSAIGGQTAVVTGASGGIGRAIALALARQGAALHLVGRRREALEGVAREARAAGSAAAIRAADLASDADLRALAECLVRDHDRIDLLIHCAAIIALGRTGEAAVEDFDRQYRINVRAPYALTQTLLPRVVAARGQIVFLNSTAGLAAGAGVGQYAATKHALKAIADSLRDEVNADGVRVLSVFAGRTASPMQAAIHRAEGKAYHPERLLQPEDVAAAILAALALPRTAEITEIRIRPERKSPPG